MYRSFLALNFSKRILIFLVVATTFAAIMLYAAILVGYPGSKGIFHPEATPRLDGYCCGYCEHRLDCVNAAIAPISRQAMSDSLRKYTTPPLSPKEEKCLTCNDNPASLAPKQNDSIYLSDKGLCLTCANKSKYANQQGYKIAVPIAPMDTWTNIAYIVIALLPFAQRVRTGTVTTLFSVFTLALGFGSGLFHAGGSFTGQLADMFGIFLVFGLLGAYSMQILLKQKNDLLVVVLTVLFIIMQFMLRQFAPGGDMTALLTIGAIIVVPLLIRGEGKQAKLKVLMCAVLFAIAETFRLLDPILCNEVSREAFFFGMNSPIQAHGLWHVISAIGIGYTFWVEQDIMHEKEKSGEISEMTFVYDS